MFAIVHLAYFHAECWNGERLFNKPDSIFGQMLLKALTDVLFWLRGKLVSELHFLIGGFPRRCSDSIFQFPVCNELGMLFRSVRFNIRQRPLYSFRDFLVICCHFRSRKLSVAVNVKHSRPISKCYCRLYTKVRKYC